MSLLETLQDTLAAEHAAVYVVEVLGGRTPSDSALYTRLQDLAAAHVERRERLRAEIEALGQAPVGPQAAYDLDGPPTAASAIRARIAQMEAALLPSYAALTADGVGALRRWAATTWAAVAVATVTWGGAPSALPGLAEG